MAKTSPAKFIREVRQEAALAARDFSADGFVWLAVDDSSRSVLAFLRQAETPTETPTDTFAEPVMVVCNFTPVPREGYRIGVPLPGYWSEILNSDAAEYGGSGLGNLGGRQSEPIPAHGQPHSVSVFLPPLAVLYFRRVK